VSSFRLDKYEVTVGRFRQFVTAWNGGAGWQPVAGSGKHSYLNGGQGLANSGLSGTFESGWVATDDSNIAPTNGNLAPTTNATDCDSSYATWTASAGSNENLPINCVNWYEAYAFCIWDGGFLPSEAEWEYAAAGGMQQREYPWGTTDPGTGNQYAIYQCYYPTGYADAAPEYCTGVVNIAPVGTASQGAGRWGQLDLAGNVEAWNLDWWASYVDPCQDCAYLEAAVQRVSRGTSFFLGPSGLAPAARGYLLPSYRDAIVGFRCARTP
jgi:formylglycine-generating enzyme required for sulfatase activity